MVIKVNAIRVGEFMLGYWMAHGKGRSRAISRSKSKKVIATRKNFIENGSRAELIGSNPHSYGLAFSVYMFNMGSQKATKVRVMDRVMFINKVINILITFF